MADWAPPTLNDCQWASQESTVNLNHKNTLNTRKDMAENSHECYRLGTAAGSPSSIAAADPGEHFDDEGPSCIAGQPLVTQGYAQIDGRFTIISAPAGDRRKPRPPLTYISSISSSGKHRAGSYQH